ncbi:hypothetical protein [Lentzea tibetensis]|nr:hypothetical protein [Lentzea tibetensis]
MKDMQEKVDEVSTYVRPSLRVERRDLTEAELAQIAGGFTPVRRGSGDPF